MSGGRFQVRNGKGLNQGSRNGDEEEGMDLRVELVRSSD